MPDDPNAFFETITFIDLGDRTEVTMHMRFADMQARADVVAFGADRLGLQTLAKAKADLAEKGLLP